MMSNPNHNSSLNSKVSSSNEDLSSGGGVNNNPFVVRSGLGAAPSPSPSPSRYSPSSSSSQPTTTSASASKQNSGSARRKKNPPSNSSTPGPASTPPTSTGSTRAREQLLMEQFLEEREREQREQQQRSSGNGRGKSRGSGGGESKQQREKAQQKQQQQQQNQALQQQLQQLQFLSGAGGPLPKDLFGGGSGGGGGSAAQQQQWWGQYIDYLNKLGLLGMGEGQQGGQGQGGGNSKASAAASLLNEQQQQLMLMNSLLFAGGPSMGPPPTSMPSTSSANSLYGGLYPHFLMPPMPSSSPQSTSTSSPSSTTNSGLLMNLMAQAQMQQQQQQQQQQKSSHSDLLIHPMLKDDYSNKQSNNKQQQQQRGKQNSGGSKDLNRSGGSSGGGRNRLSQSPISLPSSGQGKSKNSSTASSTVTSNKGINSKSAGGSGGRPGGGSSQRQLRLPPDTDLLYIQNPVSDFSTSADAMSLLSKNLSITPANMSGGKYSSAQHNKGNFQSGQSGNKGKQQQSHALFPTQLSQITTTTTTQKKSKNSSSSGADSLLPINLQQQIRQQQQQQQQSNKQPMEINQTKAHSRPHSILSDPYSIKHQQLGSQQSQDDLKSPPPAHGISSKSTAGVLINYLNDSLNNSAPLRSISSQSIFSSPHQHKTPPFTNAPSIPSSRQNKSGGSTGTGSSGNQQQAQSLLTTNNRRNASQKRTVASLLAQSRSSTSPFLLQNESEISMFLKNSKDLFSPKDSKQVKGRGGRDDDKDHDMSASNLFTLSSLFDQQQRQQNSSPSSSLMLNSRSLSDLHQEGNSPHLQNSSGGKVHRPWDTAASGAGDYSASSVANSTQILNIPTIPANVHNKPPDYNLAISNGWRRETKLINSSFMGGGKDDGQGAGMLAGLLDSSNPNLITGEVTYISPSGITCKNSQEIKRILNSTSQQGQGQGNQKLTVKNFSFNTRILVGDFLLPIGNYDKKTTLKETHVKSKESGGVEHKNSSSEYYDDSADDKLDASRSEDFIRLTADQLGRWLEETSQSGFYEKGHQNDNDQIGSFKSYEDSEKKIKIKRDHEVIVETPEERQKREALHKEMMIERERKRQHSDLIRQLEMHRRSRRRHQLQVERKLRKKMQQQQQQLDNSTNSNSNSTNWRSMGYHSNSNSNLRGGDNNDDNIENQGVVDELVSLDDLEPIEQQFIKPIKNLHLSPTTFANLLQIFEFLHTFGECLNLPTEYMPTMNNLQRAFLHVDEADEELLASIVSHLIVCAIEDPGMGNPQRHMTSFGQTLKQAEVSSGSLTEILRLYMEGITDTEPEAETYAQWLKEAPFLALSTSRKSKMLTFLCDLLLQNKAVLKFLESSSDAAHTAKKERVANDVKIRKLRMWCARKAVASASANPGQICSNQSVIDAVASGKDSGAKGGVENIEDDFDDTANLEEDSNISCGGNIKIESKVKEEILEGDENESLASNTNTKMEIDTIEGVEGDKLELPTARGGDDSGENESTTSKNSSRKRKRKESPTTISEFTDSPQPPGTKTKKSLNSLVLTTPVSTPQPTAPPSCTITSDSDGESVATGTGIPSLDPDAKLSIEELRGKMNTIQGANERLRKQIQNNMKSIRASSLGQDRWRRRYWNLPNAGGIYVEGGFTGEMAELVERIASKEKRREELRKKRKKRMKLLMRAKKIKLNKDSGNEKNKSSADEESLGGDEDDLAGGSDNNSTDSSDSLSDSDSSADCDENSSKMKEKALQQEMISNDIDSSSNTEIKKEIEDSDKQTAEVNTDENATDNLEQNENNEAATNGEVLDTNTTEEIKKKKRRKFSRIKFSFKKKRKASDVKKASDNSGNGGGGLSSIASRFKKNKKLMKKLKKLKKVKKIVRRESSSSGCKKSGENELFENDTLEDNEDEKENNKGSLEKGKCDNSLESLINLPVVEEPAIKIFNFFSFNNTNGTIRPPSSNYGNNFNSYSPANLNVNANVNVINSIASASATSTSTLTSPASAAMLTNGVVNNHVPVVPNTNFSPAFLVDYNTKKIESCGCFGKIKEKIVVPLSDDDNLVKKMRPEFWKGWWKLDDSALEKFGDKLCAKGMREAQLKDNLSTSYPTYTEELEEIKDLSKLEYALSPKNGWDSEINFKVHVQLLENLENLEERIASASLQVKGWALPSKLHITDDLAEEEIIENVQHRLIELEGAIERRYLKPPLGKSVNEIITLFHLTNSGGNLGENASNNSSNSTSGGGGKPDGNNKDSENNNDENSSGGNSEASSERNINDRERSRKESVLHQVSRSLQHWRDSVVKATTPAILFMALGSLDSSIAWDKSVMKASCQLCKGGDHEDKLLLCDACDRGYHTYCFKPEMVEIPNDDWYCYECINKATGIKCCIVCGKQGNIGLGSSNNKILCCDKCVKCFHIECLNPPLAKAPRGRWQCQDHKNSVGSGTGTGSKVGNNQYTSSTAASRKKKSEPRSDINLDSIFHSSSKSSTSPTKCRETSNSANAAASAALIAAAQLAEESSKISAIEATNNETVVPSQEPEQSQEQQPPQPQQKQSRSESKNRSSATSAAAAAADQANSTGGNTPTPTPAIPVIDPSQPITIGVQKISKKVRQELKWCEALLDELTSHDDAWPFLEPVNCRQFPTYKKVIKAPMDLTTIRARLITSFSPPLITPQLANQPQLQNVNFYKSKEGFLGDVRLIFDNCETFNEDESPVGKAGYALRRFFESKLN